MTHDSERVPCPVCGQDWQAWYQARTTGEKFLLCPECDAIWLPDDDRHERTERDLTQLFPPHQHYQVWDLIEPCDPPENA